jgi:beta-1,4-mannosyl-glycoprotein beta-1,4-N-acetylglucosaminyltransferase
MKVYDAFMLFNELDILEIRLNILDPYVDYFVISECNKTFSGLDKPFYYNENKERFKKFHHKIVHKMFTDCPDQSSNIPALLKPELTKDDIQYNKIILAIDKNRHLGLNEHQWLRDFTQREFVKRGLVDCDDEDIVMLSDLDEIPNPEILKELFENVPNNTFMHLMMKMSQYYINVRKDERWFGTKVLRYGLLKNLESNYMRNHKNEGIQIEDGGNHLTFLGGSEKIKTKIKSYGHAFDFNLDYVFGNLENNINNFQDIFNRPGERYFKVDLDESFPKYIRENVATYPNFFL